MYAIAVVFTIFAALTAAKLLASRRAKARAAARDKALDRIRGFLDVLNENFLAGGENGFAPSFEGGVLGDGSEYFLIHGEIEGRFGFDCMEIVSGEETRYRFLFQEAEGQGFRVFRGEARCDHPIADRLAALFGKYRRFHEEIRASFRKARVAGGSHSSKIDVRKLRGEHLS